MDELFAYDSKDAHDRPSVTWMHNGQEIGTYAVTADFTFTEQKTVKEIYNCIGGTILASEDYTRGIYVDGELVTENYEGEDSAGNTLKVNYDSSSITGLAEIITSNDTTPFLETGAGVLTEVFLIAPEYDANKNITKKGEVIISMVHTYLAEVTYVTDNGDDFTVGINYITKDPADVTQKALVDSSFEYKVDTTKTFEKGDMVMVSVAENAKGDMEIATINKPESVEGMATGSRIEPNVVGGSWVEVDGETYNYAHSVRGNVDDDKAMAPVENTDIALFFDDYGYVLGYSAEIAPVKYLYVEDKDESAVMGGSRIRATLADGTEEVITVTYIDDTPVSASNWAGIPSTSIFTDPDGGQATANENFKNSYNEEDDYNEFGVLLENRIYGYVVLSDGTYKLTTEIRKQFEPLLADESNKNDRREVGVLPGIEVSDNNYTYNTDAGNIYGLPAATDSVLVATPQPDTMFIFSSVHYDRPTTEKSEWFYDQQLVTANYSTQVDKTTNKFTNNGIYNNNANHTGNHYTFGIQKGFAGVLASPAKITAHDELTYPEYYTNEADSLEYVGIGGNFSSATSSNHVFLVDTQTVYVDVVNNDSWIGYNDSKLSNMTSGDVNMQVVFGNGGIADVIYINHGAPQKDSGDYFIVTDNQANWAYTDGTDTYTYTVWIEGVEETIVAKGSELTDKDGKKLNNNDLYKITAQDADYVYSVERYYEYDPFANTSYDTDFYNSENPLNGPASVVTYAAHGTMYMHQDENYVGGDKNNATSDFNWLTDNDGYSSYPYTVYQAGEYSEDAFSYDDSTVFVVLTANGVTSDDDSAKFSVRLGDVSDIQVTNQSNVYPSWVDVVAVSENDDGSTPKATLVHIIQPHVTSTYSGFRYYVEAHNTYSEPTLGMSATEEEIEAYYYWLHNNKTPLTSSNSSSALVSAYDRWYDTDTKLWNWETKAFFTDGTTEERAFVLEGWVDTGTYDMSDYPQSELAKNIMLQFAKERGYDNATIESFVTGGSATAELYGSWNGKVVGIDKTTGLETSMYLRVPFAKLMEHGVGYDHNAFYETLGYGAVYVDFSDRLYSNILTGAKFTEGRHDETQLEGSLSMSESVMTNYKNEFTLAYNLMLKWAEKLIYDERVSARGNGLDTTFDYIYVDWKNSSTSVRTSYEEYLANGHNLGATFYYYKDGALVNKEATNAGYLTRYYVQFNGEDVANDDLFALLEVGGTSDGGSGGSGDTGNTGVFESDEFSMDSNYSAAADGTEQSKAITLKGTLPYSIFSSSEFDSDYETLAKSLFLHYVEENNDAVDEVNTVATRDDSNLNAIIYSGYTTYVDSKGNEATRYFTVTFKESDLLDDASGNFIIYNTPRPLTAYVGTLNGDQLFDGFIKSYLTDGELSKNDISITADVKSGKLNQEITLTGSMKANQLNGTDIDNADFAKAVIAAYAEEAYGSNYSISVGTAALNGGVYTSEVTVKDLTTKEPTPVNVSLTLGEGYTDSSSNFTLLLDKVDVAAGLISKADVDTLDSFKDQTFNITNTELDSGTVHVVGEMSGVTDPTNIIAALSNDTKKDMDLTLVELLNNAFSSVDLEDGADITEKMISDNLSYGGWKIEITNTGGNVSSATTPTWVSRTVTVSFTSPLNTAKVDNILFRFSANASTDGTNDFYIGSNAEVNTATPSGTPSDGSDASSMEYVSDLDATRTESGDVSVISVNELVLAPGASSEDVADVVENVLLSIAGDDFGADCTVVVAESAAQDKMIRAFADFSGTWSVTFKMTAIGGNSLDLTEGDFFYKEYRLELDGADVSEGEVAAVDTAKLAAAKLVLDEGVEVTVGDDLETVKGLIDELGIISTNKINTTVELLAGETVTGKGDFALVSLELNGAKLENLTVELISVVDTSSIDAAIAAANAAMDGVVVSDDGDTVDIGTSWVTSDNESALKTAIAAATAKKGTVATVEEAEAAAGDLDSAVGTYKSAKADGLRDRDALRTALNTAGTALDGLKGSDNGNDVLSTDEWATNDLIDAVNTAVATGTETLTDDTKTANETKNASNAINEAVTALDKANGIMDDDLNTAISGAATAKAGVTVTDDTTLLDGIGAAGKYISTGNNDTHETAITEAEIALALGYESNKTKMDTAAGILTTATSNFTSDIVPINDQ